MSDTKYAELNFVRHTATGGKQENVILQQINASAFREVKGQLEVTVGRNKPRIVTKPIEQWDETIKSYEERGFIMVPGRTSPPKRKMKATGPSSGTVEPTPEAQQLIDLFSALSKQTVAETFSFSVADLTKEQIEQATEIFKRLSAGYMGMTKDQFNDELCRYFAMVPRRMQRPNDHLIRGRDEKGFNLPEDAIKEEMAKKLQQEIDIFNTMLDLLAGEEMKAKGESYSQKYGLTIRRPTEEEIRFIKRHLGSAAAKLVRAWFVEHKRREKMFQKFCADNGGLSDENHGIAHLFHGTRSENLLSILMTGLLCNPRNEITGESPIITGKAYGIGVYHAPDIQKSIGYTSSCGSKWAHGGNAVGYVLLNKVAVGLPGTQFNGDWTKLSGHGSSCLNWKKLQEVQPGALATWAEARWSGFRMDEVITYQDCQTAPEFILELAA